ncbi:hypothetical protein BCR42DRAFT_421547 [Absidia repens]|uniref:Uncharacterized protein n=1 Tax=Absidia repens TaxID=90262 RepID=A0A1X2I7U2_9FUNG|nr:hypothetical protein BCR42DRAFT_421547 [Absidia repens]
MSFTGPTGFYNAPVTKLIVVSIGALSILGAILKLKPYYHLQLVPHITVHHQFWRLFTCQFAFANSGDVFFGTMLIYSMRTIERQFGSSKYAAFVFVTISFATLLEIGALVTGIKLGFRYVPGGPYALLFAMLYQYHRMVPSLYRFQLFNITLNNKSFLYMLSFQIFISQGIYTIVPCMCGLLAGAFYRSDIANIKQWRFPAQIQSFSIHYIQPIIASPPLPRSNNALPTQRPIPSFGMEGLVASTTGIGLNTVNNDNDNNNNNSQQRRRQSTENPSAATTSHDEYDGESTSSLSTNNSNDRPTYVTPTSGTTTASAATSMREYLDALTGRAPLTSDEIQPPSQEHMAVLVSMFPNHSRDSISNALSAAQNNLNRAVEIMLTTPIPSGSNS